MLVIWWTQLNDRLMQDNESHLMSVGASRDFSGAYD